MRTATFLIALTAVAACLPTPSHADCDAYNKKFLKFNELKSDFARELDRFRAIKPLPETDVALCRAALAVMMHANVLWMNPEPSCFENKAQMKDFADKIHSLSTDAWKVAQVSCSDAEMRRP
ncbi:MAG TPA: hypothetical protein VGF53_02795 [Pseudolabrys sp.]